MKRIIQMVLLLSLALPAAAQKYPERSLVRKGNRAFAKERYDRSIDRYKSALEAAPGSWEAAYNLGNALYRTEQYDAAAEALRAAAADTLRPNLERADAWYNLGDVQFRQQKLRESLESFKSALRLNPADGQAKYNYAYVKRLLDQQENEDQQNDRNGDDGQQNQDEDRNEDQQQNGQQPDENQDGDDREQPQSPGEPEGDGDSGQGEPQPQEGRISPQEQERMLEAIQAQEDETQEKLKEKVGVVVRGKKNW